MYTKTAEQIRNKIQTAKDERVQVELLINKIGGLIDEASDEHLYSVSYSETYPGSPNAANPKDLTEAGKHFEELGYRIKIFSRVIPCNMFQGDKNMMFTLEIYWMEGK
jgi:hypothetical protein